MCAKLTIHRPVAFNQRCLMSNRDLRSVARIMYLANVNPYMFLVLSPVGFFYVVIDRPRPMCSQIKLLIAQLLKCIGFLWTNSNAG
jgi:hypothetical protein